MRIKAEGLICPEPIMLLHKAVQEAKKGDKIELFATDPSTERDVNRFCEFLGHKLLKKSIESGNFYFVIQKDGEQKNEREN